MSEEEKNIELLDRYLDGTLPQSEAEALTQRLQTDLPLRQLLHDLKAIRAGLQQAARQDVLQILKSAEESVDTMPSQSKLKPMMAWSLGIAAIIVLAVVTISIWPAKPKPEELFAQYFEPYPNVVMPLVRGTVDTSQAQLAFQQYETANYHAALRTFQKTELTQKEQLFYVGICYLILQQSDDALTSFKLYQEQSISPTLPVDWYTALAYLQKNEIEQARSLLEKLSRGNTGFQPKATKLLQKLATR